MMEWTTQCLDWEKRIVAGESLMPCPPLFPDEAAAALSVFKELRLVDVLNRPTLAEAGRPWIFDFVASIFGAYDSGHEKNSTEETKGRRLITDFFLLISKKNSKSTSASAIMMTALIRNWRESAEFLILAPTVEIANNSFYPARDMVKADEELSDLMHVQDHLRQITNRTTGATLKVIAADSETVGGKKATGILIDELWQFGNKSNAGNMILEATGGMASRPEGFAIYLSTQSDSAPAGVFAEKLQYARGVRDGRIDDNKFLPVIYEFPKEILDNKQHLDKKFWYITNPNLGASVDEQYIIHKFSEAEENGDGAMQGFLSKHLNVQIATAKGGQQWVGADLWDAAAGEVTLDIIRERSDVVVIGIDGGGRDDLLGFAVLGRDAETRKWLLWTHAWCHPIALERRKLSVARYRDFERDGDLVITKEEGQDVKELADIVMIFENAGLLDRVGVDQSGLGLILDELEGRGIKNGQPGGDRIVGIPQGWRLNGSVMTLEYKLADKAIVHNDSRMMQWCVGNVLIEEGRSNSKSVTKKADGVAKIDPIMAAFIAVALMAMNPEAKNSKSAYEGKTLEETRAMRSW